MTTETKILTDGQITSILNAENDAPGHRTMLDYARAIEQAVLQSPEIQVLRKDAERYRHLRGDGVIGPHDVFNAWWLSEHGHPPSLDEALDISMEQKP